MKKLLLLFLFIPSVVFAQSTGKSISNRSSNTTLSVDTINANSKINLLQTTFGVTITIPNKTLQPSSTSSLEIRHLGTAVVAIAPGGVLRPNTSLTLTWVGTKWVFAGSSNCLPLDIGSTPTIIDLRGNSLLFWNSNIDGYPNGSALYDVGNAVMNDYDGVPSIGIAARFLSYNNGNDALNWSNSTKGIGIRGITYYAYLKCTNISGSDKTFQFPNISGNILTDNSTATLTNKTWNSAVIGSVYGGAGTVNGILKANGSGTTSAAIDGVDLLTPTTGFARAGGTAKDSSGIIAFSSITRKLSNSLGYTTYDFSYPNNKFYYRNTGIPVLDINNGSLLTSSGLSLDWLNGIAYDFATDESMDYVNRLLSGNWKLNHTNKDSLSVSTITYVDSSVASSKRFNVLKYGAKGDGTTDNTAAFAAARDAAGVGGIVLVPSGTYIQNSLTLNKANQTWIVDANATIKVSNGSTSSVIVINAANITITGGGTIDGNESNVSSGGVAGIYTNSSSCTDLMLDKIKIKNIKGYGVQAFGSRTKIKNCSFTNCGTISGGASALIIQPSGSDIHDITVDNNEIDNSMLPAATYNVGIVYVTGSPRSGLTYSYKVYDSHITNNYIKGPSDPQGSAGGAVCLTVGVEGGNVETNTTQGGSMGISIDGCNYTQIVCNTFKGANWYGIELANANHCKVIGNTINGQGLTGKTLSSGGGALIISNATASTFCTIKGNTLDSIYATSTNHISLTTGKQYIVTNNIINAQGYSGGIVTSVPGCVISNNILQGIGAGLGQTAVKFVNTVKPATISDNTITDWGRGIAMFGTGTTVIDSITIADNCITHTTTPLYTNLSGSASFGNAIKMIANTGITDYSDYAAGTRYGSVVSASVVTANGISASVANPTSTPTFTFSLGAITPTSVNGITFSGSSTPTLNVTGTTTVSGANTGDQTNIPGNAATATALQNARTINGVSFDGTGNITVAAAAGTLTGTTLNSTVVNSSLTSVGTLANLAVAGQFNLSGNITAAAWTTSGLGFKISAATYTDNSSTGTVSEIYGHSIGAVSFASSLSATFTNGSTLFIGAPSGSSNGFSLTTQGNYRCQGTTFQMSNGGANSTIQIPNATGEFRIQTGGSNLGRFRITASTGLIGIGPTAPTPSAYLTLAAGAASASNAPLKLTSGTNLTTTEAGAIEFDGAQYYATLSNSGTRFQLARVLSATATLDFPSTLAGTASDLTITVTGATTGDAVTIGVPDGSTLSDGSFTAWVSAANTVKVRFANNSLTLALDPASGTFKATVINN